MRNWLVFAGLLAALVAAGCGGQKEFTIPEGMVHVKPGSFMMGYGGPEATPEEKPTRSVEIEKGFFIDKHEVTNGEYLLYCKGTKTSFPSHWEGKVKDGNLPDDFAKLPVVNVTFGEAEAYAKSKGKRLPTEQEWEFAARGPSSLVFPWGNEFQKGKANTFLEKHGAPVAVGSYPAGASPFGALDMAGNVWEWTSTPAQPGGSVHFIKGGSYAALEKKPRASLRGRADRGESKGNLGFRCVQELPE